ncbi:hypothetical protein PRIC2_006534 [Phytophthora ramorum]
MVEQDYLSGMWFLEQTWLEYFMKEHMSGGGEYPYPKYTWSPAGGWWAKTKNWQRKTGVALVVLVAAAAPLALYSSLNHVKFPAEERRKL